MSGGGPVRLCCGQRHMGAVCPDGKVMCCLCFGRFGVDQLATDKGQPTDVCQPCADAEVAALNRRTRRGD